MYKCVLKQAIGRYGQNDSSLRWFEYNTELLFPPYPGLFLFEDKFGMTIERVTWCQKAKAFWCHMGIEELDEESEPEEVEQLVFQGWQETAST